MAQLVPCGAVTSSAGAAVPLIPVAIQAANPVGFNSVLVQALPSNAGPVYVSTVSAAVDTTTYANVVAILPTAGAYNTFSGTGQVNEIGPGGLFMIPSTTGYGVLVVCKKT